MIKEKNYLLKINNFNIHEEKKAKYIFVYNKLFYIQNRFVFVGVFFVFFTLI